MKPFSGILFVGLIALAVAGCGTKGNSTTSSSSPNSAATTVAQAAAPAQSTAATGAPAANGESVFVTNCSSCHQANGQGVAGTFPPLAGNPVVTGDPKTVIHIVKYGLSGKIQVAGKTYNGMMPSWNAQLSDGDIAAVITYVRSSWGNKAAAVSVASVSSVSK